MSPHLAQTRVAITGIGIVSSLGRGVEATLDAVRNARSGIRTIESIDTSGLACRIGGEVPREAHEGLQRGQDRFSRFALIAAEDAAAEASFSTIGLEGDRVGVLIGT